MPLERYFELSLILGLQNILAVLCHPFRCFDPRFKENIDCHSAFIIRNTYSCRKGYSKGRLKSRESDHFNIQAAFKFHHKTLRHSPKSQQPLPFNLVTTSCMATRIVPLNIDKHGGMFCSGRFVKKKIILYNTYNSDSSSWIFNGLVSSCFDKC